VRRRSPRHGNVFTHLTAAVVVSGCIVLCWWQVTRALSGNTLSWAYVFEWPIFAGYAVFMWWKLIHDPAPGPPAQGQDPDQAAVTGADDPRVDGPTGPTGSAGSDKDTAEDEEMASYNRYLAALNASDKRKHW
jgi:hypothetical protein